VGGLVKANFPVRLVGSVVSPEDAKVASGIAGSNAERLLGRGDFLLIAKGQVVRFQAAYADSRELAGLVAHVRAGGRRRRRIGSVSLALSPGSEPAVLLPARGSAD
jgi:S-DNA-T family DNA segregation ATPase FtsK/SpoIIIE